MARVIDVAAVTQYAVPMQLFMLIPTVFGLLAYPLWPAYREALGEATMCGSGAPSGAR